MTTSTELLTPKEVAALFGVNPVTVKRWSIAGKLTAIKTRGGHRRYRRGEVLALRGAAPPAAEMLTRTQVAHLFGVHPEAVRLWTVQGRLTTIPTPGGHHRYRADEVHELLAATQSEADS